MVAFLTIFLFTYTCKSLFPENNDKSSSWNDFPVDSSSHCMPLKYEHDINYHSRRNNRNCVWVVPCQINAAKTRSPQIFIFSSVIRVIEKWLKSNNKSLFRLVSETISFFPHLRRWTKNVIFYISRSTNHILFSNCYRHLLLLSLENI